MANFAVTYRVRGSASDIVEAETLDAAKAIIDARVNAYDFEVDLDSVDDVDFSVSEMHAITRDGKHMWSTYVRPTDIRGHADEAA